MKKKILFLALLLFIILSCSTKKPIEKNEMTISIPRTESGFLDIAKTNELCKSLIHKKYPKAVLTNFYIKTNDLKCEKLCEGKLTLHYISRPPLFFDLIKNRKELFCSFDIQMETVTLMQMDEDEYFIGNEQNLGTNKDFEQASLAGFSNANRIAQDGSYSEIEIWRDDNYWNFVCFSQAKLMKQAPTIVSELKIIIL